MGRAEANIIVGASIEAVWKSLNDISHTPEWVVGLDDAEIKTQGKVGMGTVYIDHNRLGPIPQKTEWTITAFEPLSRQIHESTSMVLPSTMILNLGRVSRGTHVQMIVKYRFLPMLGPVSKFLERFLMDRLLKQVLKQNLTNLNTYLLYDVLRSVENPSLQTAKRSTGIAAQAAVR